MTPSTSQHRINGLTLSVTTAGQGPPVLLLHGFPDSARLWRYQVPALAEAGYRAIAPDQRGFGESDAPGEVEAYTMDKLAADALGVLEALEASGPVRVVGHDWGAVVGWYLAMRHPDRVDRLVALSVGHPAAFMSAGLAQKLRSWYMLLFKLPRLPEALLRARNFALVRRMMRGEKDLEQRIADLSRPGRLTAGLNWYRANLRPPSTPGFPPVRAPVMGVWSTNDIAATERQMLLSREHVEAGFRYERLEGIGHWIPLDAPERLNELLIDFLR